MHAVRSDEKQQEFLGNQGVSSHPGGVERAGQNHFSNFFWGVSASYLLAVDAPQELWSQLLFTPHASRGMQKKHLSMPVC